MGEWLTVSLKPLLVTLFAALLVFMGAAPVMAASREVPAAQDVGFVDLVSCKAPVEPAKAEPAGLWMGSLVLPGLGQVLLGDFDRGVSFFIGTAIASLVLGLVGAIVPIVYAFAQGNGTLAFISLVSAPVGCLVGFTGGWLWSVADAYVMDVAKAKRFHRTVVSAVPTGP